MTLESRKRIMLVLGTRPEAIKMAPVIIALRKSGSCDVSVCVTGQHRSMLDSVLRLFEIKPDFDLDLMRKGQTLGGLTQGILAGMEGVFQTFIPDLVLVHGDTTTAMGAALAAFYHKIDVGHVEAGLRTGNIYSPWPEEVNRKLISAIARIHFAPTKASKNNLIRESISEEKIFVTGNTVIDSLMIAAGMIDLSHELRIKLESNYPFLDNSKKLILVTGHRRENLGNGFVSICRALKTIALRNDVQIIYPVHLNPGVRDAVEGILSGHQNIFLLEPQDYLQFVYLMKISYVILTDSGGIQEEAPSLKKPVLILRNETERPEVIASGAAKLVGTDMLKIVSEVERLLVNTKYYDQMANAGNPYGSGASSKDIATIISSYLEKRNE